MKKILFATTALVATASVAAADVTFSGYGRFGIDYDDSRATKTLTTSRVRLTMDASATSDAGVEFGVRLRAEADNGTRNFWNAPRFYARSGGLEVGVGNIFGAMDSMPGLYSGTVGLTGLGFHNVSTNFATQSYSSKGFGSALSREAIEVMYSMGDYNVHVSYDGSETEIAGSATFSGWTVGLGLADRDAGSGNAEVLLTIGGAIGAANIGFQAAKFENDNKAYTLSGSFEVGAATTLTAFVAKDENQAEDMAYGIGAIHDLGGGVSLRGGIVDAHDNTRADFGVLFNF